MPLTPTQALLCLALYHRMSQNIVPLLREMRVEWASPVEVRMAERIDLRYSENITSGAPFMTFQELDDGSDPEVTQYFRDLVRRMAGQSIFSEGLREANISHGQWNSIPLPPGRSAWERLGEVLLDEEACL